MVTTLGGLIEQVAELKDDPETASIAEAVEALTIRNLKLLSSISQACRWKTLLMIFQSPSTRSSVKRSVYR